MRPQPDARPRGRTVRPASSGPVAQRPRVEDVESLTQVVTAFIVVSRLQRGQLPDAVSVAKIGPRHRDAGTGHRARRSRISARADVRYQRRRSASDVGRTVHRRTNSRMADVIAMKL